MPELLGVDSLTPMFMGDLTGLVVRRKIVTIVAWLCAAFGQMGVLAKLGPRRSGKDQHVEINLLHDRPWEVCHEGRAAVRFGDALGIMVAEYW
jgi:hypothetical protein